MTARILPSQDYFRQCLVYHAESGRLWWRKRPRDHFVSHRAFRVFCGFIGKEAGTLNVVDGYYRISLDGRSLLAHRVIWKWVTGQEPPGVDHRNRVRDDNRWGNLRAATAAQQAQHRKSRSDKKRPEALKGTSRHSQQWKAEIVANGKRVYLGVFSTEELAHAAYCEAAREMHGEFWVGG